MFGTLTSRKQGDVGLGVAIAWFASKGYTVCVPLTDNQDYDLVVEIDKRLCKVQVRTSTQSSDNGTYEVNLRVLGGNQSWSGVVKHFDPSAVDYIFILTDNGDGYLIPSGAISAKSSLTVGKKYNEFKVGKVTFQ